jgi:flavin reductase (DIM6/NTAB) family NADH-FMN oxidoreductase RutF
VTIHTDHPFLPPEDERDPARRLRGRLGATVSLWTSGDVDDLAGLTVSSYLVSPGEPPHVLALLDPDSDLAERLVALRTGVVSLLEWRHRDLADAFAGVAPAPGGAVRLGEWAQTEWGPRLDGAGAWAGIRLVDDEPRAVGWSLLVDAVAERIDIGEERQPLVHRRGRYARPSP